MAFTGNEHRSEGVGVRVVPPIRRSALPAVGGRGSVCAAPSTLLRFTPVGLVFPCCRSLQPLGHIAHDRLTDIWDGARRHALVEHLERRDYSLGCRSCEAEINVEGWEKSYAATHDEWAQGPMERADGGMWPTRFDFNLSNACNLQCVQCDGDSSSSIRIHREHRAPLPVVYGARFFEDLREFIPHLKSATFAGGEPLLGEENFRVWDLIEELAPHIQCSITTNATQWSPRIERLLESLRFDFTVSLDGITARTYESIRVGANFDSVMQNVERIHEYTLRRGTSLSINHCLMPSNYHEFGELLKWAEHRQIPVNVSVVRHPAHSAIGELPLRDIRRIRDELNEQAPEVLPRLTLNRHVWESEVARIAAWASDRDGERATRANRMVLWFHTLGDGPTSTDRALRELGDFAADGVVHEVVVGVDDRVVRCSDYFLDHPSELVGFEYHMLAKVLANTLGPMKSYDVVSVADDRMEISAAWGDTKARIICIPLRDARGRASEAVMLLAFRPAGPV